MQILRASDYRSMPWKNGGGVTTEIAVSPGGSGLEDFDWRISMARVESSGPFSTFAGIDRTLSILEGEGMLLNVDGRIPIGLTARSQPLLFPADVPATAALIRGPILDLNVMTRRGRRSHTVARVTFTAPIVVDPRTDTVFVFNGEGVVEIQAPGPVRLDPHDTIMLAPDGEMIRLETPQSATLFIIRIHANASGQ